MHMRKLLVKDLHPGMITAEDIFSIDGQLILPKKIILTQNGIEKLEAFAIYSVRIEDEEVAPPQTSFFDTPSYSERIKSNPDFINFKKSFEDHVESLQTGLNQIVESNSGFDAENLLSQTLVLIGEGQASSINMMDMLLNMRDYDDSTYAHSINSAIICNIFAGWLNLSKDERILATSCGLFHDVGKLKVPESILKKPGELTKTEFEAIKRHPLDGYNLLDQYNLPEEVKNAALMHHEKCDGSGYPYGFTADKISFFSKMVTIVDIYDAMTSNRCYRNPLCPYSVIESFEQDGFQKYDPELYLEFLRHIGTSFIGERILLNNGLEGEVVFVNPSYLSRPTIKCCNKFLDLAANQNIKITSII